MVLRHPPYYIPTNLWSHHEKLVVIDQQIGYIGGFDFCYGRMDNSEHNLLETKNLNDDPYENENSQFWPGIDFSNGRLKDFVKVQKYEECSINKEINPRMPWHDVGIKVNGDIVKDMSRHFIQYWNFAKYDIDPKKKNKHFLIPIKDKKQKKQNSNKERFIQKLKKLKNKILKKKISEEEEEEKIEDNSIHGESLNEKLLLTNTNDRYIENNKFI